jgi:hypothetical protein
VTIFLGSIEFETLFGESKVDRAAVLLSSEVWGRGSGPGPRSWPSQQTAVGQADLARWTAQWTAVLVTGESVVYSTDCTVQQPVSILSQPAGGRGRGAACVRWSVGRGGGGVRQAWVGAVTLAGIDKGRGEGRG